MFLNPSELLLLNDFMFELSVVSAVKFDRVHVLEFLTRDAGMIIPKMDYLRKAALEAKSMNVLKFIDRNFYSYTPAEWSAAAGLMALRYGDTTGF
jgi:hypothetical protein